MANLSNINDKFLVTTGGNVLIGQTAAVGSSKLQVTGASSPLAIHTPSGNNGLEFILDNGLYTNWQIGVQNQVGNALTIVPSTAAGNTTFSTPVATFLSSGNVGIGTTSPDGIFHVDGGGASIYSIFSKSDTKWMFLHTGGSNPSIGWDSAGDMRFGTSTSNVGAGFSERVRISSVGHLRVRNSEGWTAANNTEVIGHSALEVGPIRNGTNNALCVVAVAGNLAAVQGIDSVSNNVQRLPLNPFGGGVGIGVALSDGDLEVNTSTVVTGASHTVNNVLIGLQGADRPTIILDTANTTYTNRTWNITNNGSLGSLLIGRNGLDVLVMSNPGNVGIGNTTETNRKLSVSGITKTFGFVNTNNYMEKLINLPSFPNGTANLNVDIQFGNVSFWGYIELEITGTYSNQSTPGKLTKLYAIGTNPGVIYENESRVSDALGDIADNIALGDFRYDNTTGSETFAIKVSHIVSSGNSYTVKVKVFTHGNGASTVIDNLNYSSAYTETALARQYPYYHDRLGIGTTSPAYKLQVSGVQNANDIVINNTTTGVNLRMSSIDAYAAVFTTGAKFLALGTNNSQHLWISDGGNVGVGTGTFDGNERQLKIAEMSSGVVGSIFDASKNPDGGRLIICGQNYSPMLSMRHYSASYGFDLWVDVNSTWDAYFDVRQQTSGFRWRGYTSNDGGEVPLMHLDRYGNLVIKAALTQNGSPSDRKLKENIKPIEKALDKVSKLKGVSFDWKESDSYSKVKEDYGFIAQDVKKIVPELVREDGGGMLSLQYNGITPIIIEAIKEQQKMIQELKAEIELLKNK